MLIGSPDSRFNGIEMTELIIVSLLSFLVGLVVATKRRVRIFKDCINAQAGVIKSLTEDVNARATVISVLSGAVKLHHLKKVEIDGHGLQLSERRN